MARHLLSRTLPMGLLGAVALGTALPSAAATLHVAAGAPGDGDGTAGRPFAHLAPAMAAASVTLSPSGHAMTSSASSEARRAVERTIA